MSSLETTELKLKTTPTGGVDAAQSPYYRRLLSAGYKGFLQGTIGGASLYGTMGALIGAVVVAPLLATGVVAGGIGISLIAAAGGLGLLKGASTFGNIGSVAAINAESADLSEQRRYLLDRYYDLPEGPAGDREAAAIKAELEKRAGDTSPPAHIFHWKTVAIGAAIGAALVLGGLAVAGVFGSGGAAALASVVHSTLGVEIGSAAGALAASTAALISVGAAAGALAGSAIGLDRYYIRKWFDHTQDVVHSGSHKETALLAREQQVQRLKEAALEDEKVKAQLVGTTGNSQTAAAATAETPRPATASLSEAPSTHISNATLQSRLADIQKTMEMAPL